MRKSKTTKTKKAPDMVIPPEHESLLTEVHEAVKAMGRRTTGQAFDLGFEFARAKAVLPEKMFGRWMSTVCGYTPRQGRHYVAIHENLQDHRARLEGAAVSPTVMFVLASAPPGKVQEVLTAIESGPRLTVGQVKSLIKEGDELAPERAVTVGGMAGLRRAAEAKLKDELTLFTELSKRILKAVEPIAKLLSEGKHVSKKSLAVKVEVDAFKAASLLRSVIFPKQVDVSQTSNPGPDNALDGGWAGAPAVFGRLGDSPRWPGKDEFPTWVIDTVFPMLRFVVHGDPLPEKETTVVEKPADGPGPESRLLLDNVPPLEGGVVEIADHAPDEALTSDHEANTAEAVPVPSTTRAKHESPAGV